MIESLPDQRLYDCLPADIQFCRRAPGAPCRAETWVEFYSEQVSRHAASGLTFLLFFCDSFHKSY